MNTEKYIDERAHQLWRDMQYYGKLCWNHYTIVCALEHIAKLEYQRGLRRGAELGIEASRGASIPRHYGRDTTVQDLRAAIKDLNPETVIQQEVK
jgi:hypothetical protein